jgi:hypothetical protein
MFIRQMQLRLNQRKVIGNLIWKFADQKVNGFGPAHIEKSHFKGEQPAAVGFNPRGQ